MYRHNNIMIHVHSLPLAIVIASVKRVCTLLYVVLLCVLSQQFLYAEFIMICVDTVHVHL